MFVPRPYSFKGSDLSLIIFGKDGLVKVELATEVSVLLPKVMAAFVPALASPFVNDHLAIAAQLPDSVNQPGGLMTAARA
jgi:hypothetical protein